MAVPVPHRLTAPDTLVDFHTGARPRQKQPQKPMRADSRARPPTGLLITSDTPPAAPTGPIPSNGRGRRAATRAAGGPASVSRPLPSNPSGSFRRRVHLMWSRRGTSRPCRPFVFIAAAAACCPVSRGGGVWAGSAYAEAAAQCVDLNAVFFSKSGGCGSVFYSIWPPYFFWLLASVLQAAS